MMSIIISIVEKMDIDITYKQILKQSYNYLACKPCKKENINYNYTLFMMTVTLTP